MCHRNHLNIVMEVKVRDRLNYYWRDNRRIEIGTKEIYFDRIRSDNRM